MSEEEKDKSRLVEELRRLWAEGNPPSVLLRSLTSRGKRGASILVLMQDAFDLSVSQTKSISAWFSHEDDERVNRHLRPDMPETSAPGADDDRKQGS